MKKIYSVWTNKNEDVIHFGPGNGPPKFGNGEVDKELETKLYSIEAHSRSEAKAIHHLRQGWEPYKPMGKAEPCPKCGSLFYPDDYDECWKCGFEY